MGRCSTPEELERFLTDRLDALETEVIAAHLEDCAACRDVLEQITSCAKPLAVPVQSGPIESEDWVDAVLERVKAKGPRPPLVSAEDRQNRDRGIAWSLFEGPTLPSKSG